MSVPASIAATAVRHPGDGRSLTAQQDPLSAGVIAALSFPPPGPLLAQTRSADRVWKCLLFGVDRTYRGHHETDANVESPGGLSPPGAPRTVREPLDSYGSRCSAVAIERLCFVHGLLPLPDGFSWPVASAEQRSPFGPAPLQSLRPYYGLLRPWTPHRYSDPRGLSRLRSLPLHRRTGSHVPYKSLVELRAAYMPDAARAVSGHPPLASLNLACPILIPGGGTLKWHHRSAVNSLLTNAA